MAVNLTLNKSKRPWQVIWRDLTLEADFKVQVKDGAGNVVLEQSERKTINLPMHPQNATVPPDFQTAVDALVTAVGNEAALLILMKVMGDRFEAMA
jgi:hypothetical protein